MPHPLQPHWAPSTELPAVATFIAQHERRHGLISTACLHLVVGAVLLLALAALEEVGDGAARFGHLVLTDGLLGHGIAQLLQLIAGHLLP